MAGIFIILGVLATISLSFYALLRSKSPGLRRYGPWFVAAVVGAVIAVLIAVAPRRMTIQEAVDPAFVVQQLLPILILDLILAAETVLLARWLLRRTTGLDVFLVAHVSASAMLWFLTFLAAMALPTEFWPVTSASGC